MNRPEYTYSPKGSLWVVYKMTYKGAFTSGTKVFDSQIKEEAKKECYRLNGWKYKEPDKDNNNENSL